MEDEFAMKKCAACGKLFIPAPYHVYKRGNKWYHTWSCYRKGHTNATAMNKNLTKISSRKELEEKLSVFFHKTKEPTVGKLCVFLGVNRSTLKKWLSDESFYPIVDHALLKISAKNKL